jgi:hypothetical protein
MLELKKGGVNFETKDIDGDYAYMLLDKPKSIEIIQLRAETSTGQTG